jgi:hypothetical protein
VDDEEADAEKAFQGGYILGDPHLKFIPTHQTTQFATISTSRNIFTVHLFIILAIYHQKFPQKISSTIGS